MSRSVLLTGATGFVGRQILRALIESDVRVRVVVRDAARLPSDLTPERVVTTHDLFAESDDWWVETCTGIDTVIHSAWYAEPGQYLRSPLNMSCLRGSLALASGAARAGVRRFVGLGSCTEYDTRSGDLSIDTPLLPESPYAAAKVATYCGLAHWLPSQRVQLAWCRLFYLYGEGEDERRLAAHIRARLAVGETADLTSGTQVRDFLDVRDAGRMIADVALGTVTGPVNICSGVPTTVRQLAERIADEYGRRDLLRFGVRPDNLFDPPRVVGIP
ncbi:MAG TPA: NAD(P)-dependent oxidoreductase [Gemmatimonadaceae bacterium]|nr:NAD(P)-dependent oxidoreductase [Gemmatimonadaceae bacterium]